jgi:membrane associated rhomboid family serine protease
VRGDEHRRPTMTMALVAIGCLWWLATIPLRDEGYQLVLDPLGAWWQVLTAPFIHVNGWYQFAALGAVGIFGWMLERKHGWLVMLGVWLVTASGAMAIVKAVVGAPEGGGAIGLDGPVAVGASYGALGLLCAWAVPILLERSRRGTPDGYDHARQLSAAVPKLSLWRRLRAGGNDVYDEADLLGAGVIFVLLAAMPAALEEVSFVGTAAATVLGALLGLLLARRRDD